MKLRKWFARTLMCVFCAFGALMLCYFCFFFINPANRVSRAVHILAVAFSILFTWILDDWAKEGET